MVVEARHSRGKSFRSGNLVNRPKIAITMGDPAGIGPEICLRLLADESVRLSCVPVIYGDRAVLERCAKITGLPTPDNNSKNPQVLDLNAMDVNQLTPGIVSAATGLAAYRYIESAIEDALADKVAAVVTGPIHKEALRAAGIPHAGHTEIFAEKTKAASACMMLTSPMLTCSFVTVHVGYYQVPGLLSVDRVLEVIELTTQAINRIHGRAPKLVVCGLNPHAGEHGLFGNREEERFIIPAIEIAKAKGITIEGPLPPDTAFLAARRKVTDAYICMYHDQGHIPLKALAFEDAINITLGLPIIRTSVDHGTACDIAWQGKANPSSLIQAVQLAVKLAIGAKT
jgi:4-hydroxythreonine-4-phosphate dehydrogenase